MLRYMVNKQEAFEAVLHRKRITFKKCGNPFVDKINKKIVDNVNRGWLCANLTTICNSTEIINITADLEDLGYTVENGILYWLYRD